MFDGSDAGPASRRRMEGWAVVLARRLARREPAGPAVMVLVGCGGGFECWGYLQPTIMKSYFCCDMTIASEDIRKVGPLK